MGLYSSQQDQTLRQSRELHISQRWTQLYELEKEWGERALKYLLLTNAGGAIAVLGFLGASPAAINLASAKISLVFFLMGVLFVGVSTAKQFHKMSYLAKSWYSDVDQYYADKITWSHLRTNDDKRTVAERWDYVLPYSAFGCLFLGSIAGGCSLFL